MGKILLYFCHQCKKNFPKIDEMLFVEDGSGVCFCNEKCIEKFFVGHVNFFSKWEKDNREKLGLTDEDCLSMAEDVRAIEKVCTRPKEIWLQANELKEEIYSFIDYQTDSMGQKVTMAVICLIFLKRPSYIFLVTATKSEEFLQELRLGIKIENPETFLQNFNAANDNSLQLPPEVLSFLENKKSTLLAQLLQKRTAADIPVEQFPLYEDYYRTTLETPDEIYHFTDDEGDELYTYIRAQAKEGASFYYLIICTLWDMQLVGQEQHLLPIFSFPTNDGELYHHFRRGELLSGNIKS